MRFLATCISTVALATTVMSFSLESIDEFHAWADVHGKDYNDAGETLNRYGVWLENKAVVEAHNRAGKSWTMRLNAFGDMTDEEFNAFYLGAKVNADQDCSATKGTHVLGAAPLNDRIDWREKEVVSDVKNQGSCGSCWTFSTTGAMEAHWAIATGEKVLLSEQNLIDCAQAFDNHGCNGGLPSHAFEYIRYNGGIDTEDGYPYAAKDQKCAFNRQAIGATTKGSVNITYLAEDELLDALSSVGPVSIAYQVASDFRFYAAGVYDSTVCKSGKLDVNHAVLAVGYDTDANGVDYYIMKNSWGESFGINGYFHIVRGKNMCGLADCAAYPAM